MNAILMGKGLAALFKARVVFYPTSFENIESIEVDLLEPTNKACKGVLQLLRKQ
jgi:hypothetical protein